MRFAILFPIAVLIPSYLRALEPADVWLIVNKNEPDSRRVADHYIAKRGVPKGNVVELDLPKSEDIPRADYDAKFAGPLREALKGHKEKVKVLLTTYGVPLRVGRLAPNESEKRELDAVNPQLEDARKKLAELQKRKDADKMELDSARALVNKLAGRELFQSELVQINVRHAKPGQLGAEITGFEAPILAKCLL